MYTFTFAFTTQVIREHQRHEAIQRASYLRGRNIAFIVTLDGRTTDI